MSVACLLISHTNLKPSLSEVQASILDLALSHGLQTPFCFWGFCKLPVLSVAEVSLLDCVFRYPWMHARNKVDRHGAHAFLLRQTQPKAAAQPSRFVEHR